MQIYFVVALVFAVLVAIFAIQNSTPVHIKFLFWEIKRISQVLVILGAAAVGALAVLFMGTGKQIRLIWQIRQLTQQNARLREECQQLRQKNLANLNSSGEQLEPENNKLKQEKNNTQ